MKPYVFDLETKIGTTVHGPDFRDPNNDFFTVIAGKSPDSIDICHKIDGFNRNLPREREFSDVDLIVGHNLGFDLSYIFHTEQFKEFILRGGKIWCTQVAEYILTAQQHQYSSLAELQLKYLGKKEKLDRISMLYSDKTPNGKKKKSVGADEIMRAKLRCKRVWREYEKYCKLDGSTTLQIFKQQYLKAKRERMLPIIELYQDYLLSLINMSCTGINLDIPQTEKLQTEFALESIEYLKKAQTIIAPAWSDWRLPPFNINSSQHKSAVLFGGTIKNTIRTKVGKYLNGNDKYRNILHEIPVTGFKVPTKYTTPSKADGFYSVDKKAVLPKIKKDAKNPKLLKYINDQLKSSEYDDAGKVIKAFLKYQLDGVLYPNFNNTTVITGRLSSSNPNLQNVTKKTAIGKALHKLFVAPQGWKCVQLDFGQLEIWVSALLSKDQQLIDDLLSGLDMHCMRVSLMEGCDYEYAVKMCKELEDPVWVSKRSAAKTFSYQRAYGAGVAKLVEYTGLSKEAIQDLIKAEEERYPQAATLWRKVGASVNQSKAFSRATDKPRKQKSFKNTYKGFNLLQIFDKSNNVVYNREEVEKIGFWRSITGKRYHFPDTGNWTKEGIKRSVTPTILKNYPMQGTAADIQGATTAALLKLLVKHPDKIKMINEVHDSKWFYIREEYLDRMIGIIRNIVEDVPKIFKERFGVTIPFKFPVDIEVGDNFSEMYSYN